ncbi:hypothetical protein Hanom_Chr07g00599841 [Helianthus anomalus]
MVKTWWIRRWYFLYISDFTILPNFRKTCHEKFGVLRTLFKHDTQTLMTYKRTAKMRDIRLSITKPHPLPPYIRFISNNHTIHILSFIY